MIDRLDSGEFDWLRWRAGSPMDVFGLSAHQGDLISRRGRNLIRQYAVGWCPGEKLLCRPKPGTIGVMFLRQENFFWFHILLQEFSTIFPA